MSVIPVQEPYLVHVLPGRIRVRLSRANDPADARRVEQALLDLRGVHGVTANPLTGNALIRFDPRATDARSLLAALRAAPAAVEDPSLRTVASDPARALTVVRDQRRPGAFPREDAASASALAFRMAGLIAGLVLADTPLGLALTGVEILSSAAELVMRRDVTSPPLRERRHSQPDVTCPECGARKETMALRNSGGS